jgi:hypothetical protein
MYLRVPINIGSLFNRCVGPLLIDREGKVGVEESGRKVRGYKKVVGRAKPSRYNCGLNSGIGVHLYDRKFIRRRCSVVPTT